MSLSIKTEQKYHHKNENEGRILCVSMCLQILHIKAAIIRCEIIYLFFATVSCSKIHKGIKWHASRLFLPLLWQTYVRTRASILIVLNLSNAATFNIVSHVVVISNFIEQWYLKCRDRNETNSIETVCMACFSNRHT